MTYPLILAKIPVKNPWEIFAYLPFGGWNECPNTPELMAVAKYWFEQHGAVPAAMSHDELEFLLPAPVSEKEAIDVAVELYGFCPDVIDQGPEDATVGALADVLAAVHCLVLLVGLTGGCSNDNTVVSSCSCQGNLKKKPWKVCWRRLPVKTEIPSAKLKRAAF